MIGHGVPRPIRKAHEQGPLSAPEAVDKKGQQPFELKLTVF
jgi:hypothetical protein